MNHQTKQIDPAENKELKSSERKEPKIKIRDLKPKKDIIGGASSGGNDKKSSAEMDFMNWD